MLTRPDVASAVINAILPKGEWLIDSDYDRANSLKPMEAAPEIPQVVNLNVLIDMGLIVCNGTDDRAMRNLILVSGEELVLAPVEFENLRKGIATDPEYGGKNPAYYMLGMELLDLTLYVDAEQRLKLAIIPSQPIQCATRKLLCYLEDVEHKKAIAVDRSVKCVQGTALSGYGSPDFRSSAEQLSIQHELTDKCNSTLAVLTPELCGHPFPW
jgi:hypothetical protein